MELIVFVGIKLKKKKKEANKKTKKNEPVVIKMLKNGGNLLPWPEFE